MSAGRLDLPTRAVDFVVGLVSPRRAVVRQHFRRMEREPGYRESVFTLLRARGYRSTESSKNKTPFAESNGSADFEVIPARFRLRARARELNRDDPIASGATKTFTQDIVGTELRAQSRAEGDAGVACENVWLDAKARGLTPADGVPFGQVQRILAKKVLEDGEIFVKRAVSSSGEPVWFEIVEAERVSTPGGAEPLDFDGNIRDGVEKDDDGKVVAYWINKTHPGDWGNPASYRRENFERVLADAVRHVKLVDRPGQTRGATYFHAVLQDVRDLDLLMVASLKRVQVAACFSVFIKSQQVVPDLLEVTATNYGYQLQEDLVPGTLFKLLPGEDIETLTPNFPSPELGPFVVMLARRIGAALGVSWQAILHDWSDSNYSSARTQILSDRITTNIYRVLLVEGVLDWMWQTVLEDAQLNDDERLRGVALEDLKLVQWIANAREWIDPLKESRATQLKLQMGITTLRDECAAQGKDWRETKKQQLLEEKYELDMREELGLPPRAVTGGADTSSASQAAADEAATEDAVTAASDGRKFRRVA